MSNEKEIREAVKKYLSDAYENLTIKEEFGVFLDSRNDVMGVSFDNIISVEIKSDKDNFSRLEKQLKTYMGFSTITYVALDISHLSKYQDKFLTNSSQFSSVGILVYENNKLKIHKKPYRSDFGMYYELLTSQEKTLFLNCFKGKSLIPKDMKTTEFLIEDIFTYREIKEISKHIFISRFLDNAKYFSKSLFKDFEKSQQFFNKWLHEDNWNMYTTKHLLCVSKKNFNPKQKRSSLKVLER
ncbi:hypothetical protein ACNSOO_04530 [Aliarcobacter lanthieri]|uniref:hypothetical protein n=1 Tax=Aliarcobacter lanthieri TaxID=1355374 RepID=UPI003AAFECD3